MHVIADGDILTGGDIAVSIACGADAVMLGSSLADADGAPGLGYYWTSAAAHPSLPRSHIWTPGAPSGLDLEQLFFGPSSDPSGDVNLFGALRRALAKTGYKDLKEFQKVGLTVSS